MLQVPRGHFSHSLHQGPGLSDPHPCLAIPLEAPREPYSLQEFPASRLLGLHLSDHLHTQDRMVFRGVKSLGPLCLEEASRAPHPRQVIHRGSQDGYDALPKGLHDRANLPLKTFLRGQAC